MRCGPASSTCQVVQRYSTLSGSGPFSHGTYPCPHRCPYHGLTGAALTAALSPHAPSVSQEPTPRRTEHWRGEPRKASLGHPFVPFRASPYLITYACPPWVTPVYPGLRWLSPTGCRLLGTLPQHARHLGLGPFSRPPHGVTSHLPPAIPFGGSSGRGYPE